MWKSRKLTSAWVLTALATILFIVPSLLSVLGVTPVWVLLGADHWVTLMSLLWGAYFAANVGVHYTQRNGNGGGPARPLSGGDNG